MAQNGDRTPEDLSPDFEPTPSSAHGFPKLVSKTKQDSDDNYMGSNDREVDEITINRIYRKLDWRIMPPFWGFYFLASAVRSNVSLAQTMNVTNHHDLASVLHLSQHQVSTGLALFYVCYVIFEVPSNLVMTRLNPGVWLSRIIISIGVVGTFLTAMKAVWSFYLLRCLLGVVTAGMWPGMTYYLTLFYPPSRIGKRIGIYFTAAQVSAAVVGLVSAGFQKMDGLGDLVGFQWMFLIYGLVTFLFGISLLWWLPDRPVSPGETIRRNKYLSWLVPAAKPALTGLDAEIHFHDLRRVYVQNQWTLWDLVNVLLDWRLWPLIIMYFGVVGIGYGVESYGNVLIAALNPNLSDIDVSLLFAPIWIMDLISILLVTPISDRFHHHRALFFSISVLLQILGLLLTTFSGSDTNSWPRYGGLLIVGFGLGPTVPITMTWTAEIFQARHGELGVAAATALISGLGNLGSVVTTYALYAGWPADYEAKGRAQYRNSNLVMVAIATASILAALTMEVCLRITQTTPAAIHATGIVDQNNNMIEDGAAKRESQQRGLKGLFPRHSK